MGEHGFGRVMSLYSGVSECRAASEDVVQRLGAGSDHGKRRRTTLNHRQTDVSASMSLPERTTVLIVGAGPTGLAAALSLVHHDFRDFLIVDAVLQGENTSRALVVHAATLEALDTIACGDDLVSKGTKASAFTLGTRTTDLVKADIGCLTQYTRHPYALIIPQNFTESILEKKLASFGITVHRPFKVISLKPNEKSPQLIDVAFDNGKIITTSYVVGADGARSVVRSMAGIGFSDPNSNPKNDVTNLAQMILADVTFDGGNPDQLGFCGTMSSDSFFLCVPLPLSFNEFLAENGQVVHETIYRIGCGVPLEDGEIPHAPPKEYLQGLVDRFGPTSLSSDPSVNPSSKPVCIKEPLWATRFRTRCAIADKVFTRLGSDEGGAIVLIGDAAHIHSPAGGQGMNLGLRDAVFLGDVLTKHIKATESKPLPAADTILEEFAAVRHARAIEVIGFTKALLSIAGMKNRDRIFGWLPISSVTVRDWVLWIAGKLSFTQGKMAWNLSGLGRR